jgi:uncharacterized SAM-binding protein YcdF (DUF218 family)
MYLTIPQANTDLGKFDVVIILGTPAKGDGTPSPEQRERVLEGVREYRGGIAPHLIMTGGAAHNRWVEADVMERLAESKGVASEAIVEERQALNTIQNAYYSVKIMQAHGWRSAEVVSSPSHLPRASLIFSHFPIKWKMHSANWPAGYTFRPAVIYALEALYTTRLRVLGFRSTPYLPAGDGTAVSTKNVEAMR